MNGDILKEVRELLEEGRDISSRTAMRMMLTVQLQMYEKLNEINLCVGNHDKKIEILEQKNIVIWAERHPKMFALSVAAVFLLNYTISISGFRKPIIHGIVKEVFKVDLPYDQIP